MAAGVHGGPVMQIDFLLPVFYAFGGAAMLLIVASFIAAALPCTQPGRDYTELRPRIRTWWYILAGYFVAMAFSRVVAFTAPLFFHFLYYLYY